jgi:hypothetical protein
MSAKILLFLCVLACQHNAVVSQTSPPPYCVYNNTVYEIFAEIQIDKCTYGYCGTDGQVYTTPVDCPQDPCPMVYEEGECCGHCPVGWSPTCSFQNQTYEPGPVSSDDPCQTCQCPDYGGDVECFEGPCEGCEYGEEPVQPGECCPRCKPKTCEYNGQTYQLDSTFQTETCMSAYCDPDGALEFYPSCCEYENTTYSLGSSFTIDPCTFGYCEGGQVSIAVAGCPGVPCPYPVYSETECCPRCPDDWVPTCTFEGQTFNVGPIPTTDPCQSCECPYYGGDAQCYWQACTTCAYNENVVYIPGQCCPECQPKSCTDAPPQVCEYNGQIHEFNSIFPIDACTSGYCGLYGQVFFIPTCCPYEGTTYALSSGFKVDSCTLGYCESDGNVTVATTCCDELPCPNPVHDDGECCPRCPGDWVPICIFEGQTYNVGTIPTSNPCQFCECPPTGGEPVCAWAACAPCPYDEYAVPRPGQCCPDCYPIPTSTTPPGCDYDGQIFEINSTILEDGCRSTYCDLYGGVSFAPTCCEYENQIYELNSDFTIGLCTWGHCESDGEVSIAMAGCQSCIKYENVPGQCCPKCVPACSYKGIIYDVGPVPSTDPCQVCECVPDGEVLCYPLACESCQDYEDSISVPGQCCPDCQARPTTSLLTPGTPPPSPAVCEYAGETYNEGPIPTNSPCVMCECPPGGGDPLCSEQGCVPCPYYTEEVIIPGQCCPDCHPLPSPTPSRAVCYFEGQRYQVGPVPSSDPCQTCECPPWGDEVECYPEPCRSCPGWADDYPLPGECCPRCENEPKP